MNKIESIKKENLNETNNVSSAELFGIKTSERSKKLWFNNNPTKIVYK